jgi:hypothetical protein
VLGNVPLGLDEGHVQSDTNASPDRQPATALPLPEVPDLPAAARPRAGSPGAAAQPVREGTVTAASPAALLVSVAEVLGVVPPSRAPHPRDVLDRFRGALVELEIEVSRWELSGSAANDNPVEEVRRATLVALRRLTLLGVTAGQWRPMPRTRA